MSLIVRSWCGLRSCFESEGWQLVITGPVVCKTCAYYVGHWCGEYMADAIGAPSTESGKEGNGCFSLTPVRLITLRLYKKQSMSRAECLLTNRSTSV